MPRIRSRAATCAALLTLLIGHFAYTSEPMDFRLPDKTQPKVLSTEQGTAGQPVHFRVDSDVDAEDENGQIFKYVNQVVNINSSITLTFNWPDGAVGTRLIAPGKNAQKVSRKTAPGKGRPSAFYYGHKRESKIEVDIYTAQPEKIGLRQPLEKMSGAKGLEHEYKATVVNKGKVLDVNLSIYFEHRFGIITYKIINSGADVEVDASALAAEWDTAQIRGQQGVGSPLYRVPLKGPPVGREVIVYPAKELLKSFTPSTTSSDRITAFRTQLISAPKSGYIELGTGTFSGQTKIVERDVAIGIYSRDDRDPIVLPGGFAEPANDRVIAAISISLPVPE